jgi:hypothetical protein
MTYTCYIFGYLSHSIYNGRHRDIAFTGFHPSKSKLRLDFGAKIPKFNDPQKG